MTTYQHAPDGDGEDCLWFRHDGSWQPLMRRCDLPAAARVLWADVVTGVLSRSDGQAPVLDDDPCSQCGHERWMHDERGCSYEVFRPDACECVRFDGPRP